MIVQEDVPYTKEEVNAMVKTIHDLREQLKRLGWHPASELPPVNENLISELVLCWCVDQTFGTLEPKLGRVWRGEWCFKDVKWWCYPPKED